MTNNGYEIKVSLQYSNPKDAFLYTVLGVDSFGRCVVWTYNTQVKGFSNGDYFTMGDTHENLKSAMGCFIKRVR